MKTAIVVSAVIATVLLMVILDRPPHRGQVVVAFPGYHPATNTPLILSELHRATTIPNPNTMVEPVTPGTGSAWLSAQEDALPVLLKYLPDATEEQRNAATHYVYHYRSFKPEWVRKAGEINQHLSDLNDPAVPESSRTELRRVHEAEWKMMAATVKDVMDTLKNSEASFFAKHGFTNPNLQSDLYQVANPPGKEPWEE